MACLFTEGFDKYGPTGILGNATTTLLSMLLQEWNSSFIDQGITVSLGTPLTGSAGSALVISNSFSYSGYLNKTLPTNYTTLVGGFRCRANLGGASGIQFNDGVTVQCSIAINSSGTISIKNGGCYTGTVLATSATSIAFNSVNYIEWQITFGTSASYQVWINGISVISGTGNTRSSTNNYANGFSLGMFGRADYMAFDDLYIFDTTTSFNNSPLLTNPVIETLLPTSDGSVAFTTGVGVLGQAYYTTAGVNSPGANELALRLFTPTYNCTLNGIGLLPQGTSGTANLKAVLYATSGSVPGALLNVGTQVTGTTSGSALNLPFASSNSLISGTQYAIGLITDTAFNIQQVAGASTGQKAANTYTSGAPNTAPVMTTAQADWMIWGNISGMTSHYTQSNENPSLGALSYNQSSTPGQSELYGFQALQAFSGNVYAVSVKAAAGLVGGGARMFSLRLNSSGNVSAGSIGNVFVGENFSYIDSAFNTDPNTGGPWTGASVNAVTAGITIVS